MSARSLSMVLGLLLWPGLAVADPISAVAFLAPIIGGTAAAFVVSYAGTIAMVSLTAYSAISARNKARKRAAAARAAYNSQLQDRMVTALSIDPPKRMILGRAETGGSVVAMFTTDKALADGGVKPDAYKHLVIVWAAHQCHQIHDIKIDGVSLGELDHVGNSAADHWDNPRDDETRSSTAPGTARSLPLPDAKGVLLVLLNVGGPNPRTEQVEGWTLAAGVLTLPSSVNGYTPGTYGDDQWEVTAIRLVGQLTNPVAPATTVRVVHHLGAADQEADSYLMGLVPAQWTAEHRLRGLCYSVVTLDLERTQFQSGPPGITADISGALVLDRRTGTTAWSNNPALLIDHWLRSEMGYGVGLADVDAASVIAAANACDVPVSFASGSTTVTEARYTCNGVITSDTAKEVVLADLAESMAGWASYSGGWRVQAGVWAPPVMDLSDNDLAGPINIVQAGEPSSELYNGVRGQYIPAGSAVPAEFEPYQVAAFLAADGRALWTDLDLPFTNSKARAKNICRVLTEQARNGLIIHFPAQMRAWPLQAGDRVRVSSTEYGWAHKSFRVTDWGFGITAPVGLTLQEDAPEAYDEADAVVADPTPNTQLPDPWVVPALGGLTLESGTAHLQKLGDGTIISRVKASWPRVTAPYMNGGRIELAWRAAGSSTWVTLNADPDDTSTYITGVADRKFIFVAVVVVNSHGARSRAFYGLHQVVGKTEPPRAVQFLGASVQPGLVRIGYQPCPDLDYDYTLLRVGASWATGTALPGLGDKTGYDWSWPAIGTYTVWAVHVDTSGNLSTPASLAVNVTSAVNVGAGVITPDPEWINSNVLVGGRNLLPGAGNGAGWSATTVDGDTYRIVRAATTETGYIFSPYISLPPNTQIALSFESMQEGVVSSCDFVLLPDNYAVEGLLTAGYPLSASWVKRSFLLTTPPGWTSPVRLRFDHNGGNGTSSAVCIRRVKLEYGNVVTDWTPPVEDVAAASALAKAAADGAAVNATAALNRIQAIDSDGVLSRGEKPEVIAKWTAITIESSGIDAQAVQLAITTERTAWQAAKAALGSYLSGLSPAYSDTSQDTVIVPAVDRQKWVDYYTTRQALLNKIAAAYGSAGGVNMIWGATGTNAGPGTYGVTVAYLRTPSENRFGLLPGEQITISADVWQDGVSAAAGQYASVYLYCMDVSGNWTGNTVTITGSGQAQAGSRGTATLTLPAEAQMRYVVVGLYHQGGATNTAGTVLCERVQVERGPVATQYSPGAEPGATVGATWGVNIGAQPFDYEQEATPSGANPGSTWFIPSLGKAFKLVGGSWRALVGVGSVATSELSANAATEFVNFFYAAGIVYSNLG